MRAEFAKLRRRCREMQAAIGEMIANAMALADYVAALTPDRPVSDAELTVVENGVVAIVLDQTREELKKVGASEARLAYLDGPGAACFRAAFSRQFRAQATLAVAFHEGVA